MKWRWIFCVLLLGLSACGNSDEPREVPPDILPQEKMVEVVTDLQFEIALHQKRYVQRNRLYALVADRYEAVYEQHGLTKEEFEKSFEWYKQDPRDLQVIYELVLEELTIKMGELRAKRSRPQRTQPAEAGETEEPTATED